MEEHTIDLDQPQQAAKRPTFLTVLCILTFVGSGLGLLSAIASFTVLSPANTYSALELNASRMNAVIPAYEEFATWTTYNTIVSTISTLLGLIAGIMMWKLNKSGFYIYLLSWIAPVVMTAVSFKHVSDSVTADFFPIVIALNVLIMAAFVIMYAVNLKHMK